MFWYIGGVLEGFAIGYLVAISKPQKTGYRRGKRDCRNCKHTKYISSIGWITCELKSNEFTFECRPEYCASYEKIEDGDGKT